MCVDPVKDVSFTVYGRVSSSQQDNVKVVIDKSASAAEKVGLV